MVNPHVIIYFPFPFLLSDAPLAWAKADILSCTVGNDILRPVKEKAVDSESKLSFSADIHNLSYIVQFIHLYWKIAINYSQLNSGLKI